MNLLALDTSTDTLFVAVQRGDAVWQYSGPGAQQSSAQLLPAIRQLMQEAQLEFKQLDAIAFGRGPGSFTGLRTACAITQGLAFAAHVPVLPVDSLLTVAEEARHLHGCTEVEAVLDARMNEVYHAAFRFVDGQWVEPEDFGLCAPEALQVAADLTVAGNAQSVYPELLAPAATHVHALPTATAMLRLAPALLAKGCAVPAEQALPRYIRDKVAKTTAERESEKAAAAQAATLQAAQ
ncbi:MAG: tRNA (adenosine(37)-N6)-threonylcarbamoyltransferase complex dimerization subunit type 1 TsaB [Comamonas sp.]|jgi:tRNA threonylcarbamoyladenosine biosynthesis protein TsaB|nr:tRNA (adenosine(37)-N6)-threonylcarbamoyltransferase complex dimerization subunit type 1 TsaB [Comamonas sp.]